MRAIAVRALRKGELKKLRWWASRGRTAHQLRWAQITLARAVQGLGPSRCAQLFGCSGNTVTNVVRRWNAQGPAMFQLKKSTGRPATFSDAQRQAVVKLAKESPQAAGKPWNQWSLHKIVDAATGMRVVARISHETVRQWLCQAGITPQRLKTWKSSNDPQYVAKKNG